MKTWIRRIVLLCATVIVILMGGALVALHLVRSEPAFYRPRALSAQERATAAQSAEDKFIQIQNSAARINAASTVARRSAGSTTTTASLLEGQPVTITFTDAELNSFFEKWSKFQDWKGGYEAYVTEPAIILQKGRIILAAKLNERDWIVSLHFEPNIDEHGELDLNLVSALAGRVPAPEWMFSSYKEKATAAIERRLPVWKRGAAINADGAANADAIATSLAKVMIDTMRHERTDPVMYLPVFGRKGSVPVKIRDLAVEEGSITLTVEPMTRDQQAALLQRIRTYNPTSVGRNVKP